MEGLAGMSASESRTAGVTVSVVELLIELDVAVMIVAPKPILVAKPWLPGVLLIVATAALEELHVADEVRSCVLPSLKVRVAVNCWLVPRGIEGLACVVASDSSTGGATGELADPPPHPAKVSAQETHSNKHVNIRKHIFVVGYEAGEALPK